MNVGRKYYLYMFVVSTDLQFGQTTYTKNVSKCHIFKKVMFSVKLYVYDLSNGMARQLSQQLIGRRIEGIWCVVLLITPPRAIKLKRVEL
jgi:hypothetical protein